MALHMSMSLVLGSPELGTALQEWPHWCWVESAGSAPPCAAQDTISLCWLIFSWVSSRSFPANVLPGWPAPSMPWCLACSSLNAGLGTSPCWCAWASCQPSSSHSGSLWMAAQPSGVSGIPPSYVSSSALLRLCSPSSSRSLMKVLNRTGPYTDPWGALLPSGLQLDFMPLVTCHQWWFFVAFYLVGYTGVSA